MGLNIDAAYRRVDRVQSTSVAEFFENFDGVSCSVWEDKDVVKHSGANLLFKVCFNLL